MAELFLKLVNMSIAATWLVLAVLVLRLLLRKAPKWVNVLLWGIVAIRLICPVTLESALSLIPSSETIRPEIMLDRTPTIDSGVPAINSAVNPIITESFAPAPLSSANPLQIWIPVAANFWLLGMLIMLVYTAVSYWRLRRRVKTAVRLREHIFQCENVSSPFVLGILRPKIYLPFAINEQDAFHVIAHEQAHIRRKDHWWKPLGFLLLTLHWFNPILWLGYILLCRDIELACDEKVIRELGAEQRADYSQALLSCSVSRGQIAACPLAFGEAGVKTRVRSILSYKKPAFWIIVAALLACVAVSVCFLTDPVSTPYAITGALRAGEVEWAQVTSWSEGSDRRMLTQGQIQELVDILNALQSSDFRPESHTDNSTSIMLSCADKEILLRYDGIFVDFVLDSETAQNAGDRVWSVKNDRLIGFFQTVAAQPTQLTLDAVTGLSRKGMALTWEDLAAYAGQDIGSGMYIVQYHIDADYCLVVGGGETTAEPMYANLCSVSTGEWIDIRTEDVAAFVTEQDELRAALMLTVTEKASGTQATLLPLDEGIFPAYTREYGQGNTVTVRGVRELPLYLSGSRRFTFSDYKIYLPDGTVYDDGTRNAQDSLGLRIMLGEQMALLTPFEAGTYIYQLTLHWPEYDKTMTYGLQVIMTDPQAQESLQPTVEGTAYESFVPLAMLEGLSASQIKALLVSVPLEKLRWSWGEPDQTVAQENTVVYRIPDTDASVILRCSEDGIIEDVTLQYSNGLPYTPQ